MTADRAEWLANRIKSVGASEAAIGGVLVDEEGGRGMSVIERAASDSEKVEIDSVIYSRYDSTAGYNR